MFFSRLPVVGHFGTNKRIIVFERITGQFGYSWRLWCFVNFDNFQACSNQTAQLKNTPVKDQEKAHPRDSQDKDPASVNFFDESGFQLPDVGHRNFGFSPVGNECVDVRRYLSTANKTLNFLVGLDGVKSANMLEGASNSYEFLKFFD